MGFSRSHQEWGGRRKSNPENCPKITAKQVYALADKLGLKIRRGEISLYDHKFYPGKRGCWDICRDGKWFGLGCTNYIAYQNLTNIQEESANGKES